MVFFRPATGAALVPAVGFFVHSRPGAPFGLLLRNAAVLVAFLDVLGLALLLLSVTGLVAAGHGVGPRYGKVAGDRRQELRRLLKRLACSIHPDSGMPSRCRPPASAPAHATTAPSRSAVATEKARMMVLARTREIAVLESAITVSTRRSASAPVRPVVAETI